MMKRIIAVVSFVSIVLTVLWSHRAYSSLMLDSYVVCAGVLLALGVQNLFNDETGGYGQFIQRVMTVTAGLWLIVNLGQYSGNLTSASAAAIVLSLVWTGLRNHS